MGHKEFIPSLLFFNNALSKQQDISCLLSFLNNNKLAEKFYNLCQNKRFLNSLLDNKNFISTLLGQIKLENSLYHNHSALYELLRFEHITRLFQKLCLHPKFFNSLMAANQFISVLLARKGHNAEDLYNNNTSTLYLLLSSDGSEGCALLAKFCSNALFFDKLVNNPELIPTLLAKRNDMAMDFCNESVLFLLVIDPQGCLLFKQFLQNPQVVQSLLAHPDFRSTFLAPVKSYPKEDTLHSVYSVLQTSEVGREILTTLKVKDSTDEAAVIKISEDKDRFFADNASSPVVAPIKPEKEFSIIS